MSKLIRSVVVITRLAAAGAFTFGAALAAQAAQTTTPQTSKTTASPPQATSAARVEAKSLSKSGTASKTGPVPAATTSAVYPTKTGVSSAPKAGAAPVASSSAAAGAQSAGAALRTSTDPTAAAPPTPPPAPLNAEQTLNLLADMVETLKRINRADNELYGEVTRHQETVVADLADAAVMNPYDAAPGLWPSGFANDFETVKKGPLLPPRPQYINLSMDQMERLIALLNSDLAQLMNPQGALFTLSDDVRAQAKVFRDTCNSIASDYTSLKPLTTGPKYDNKAIGTCAKTIHDDLKGVNDVRKRLLDMLKHDEKESRK
jgi:hypothetical protein